MRVILRDINKNGVEIGERQNRCHDDIESGYLSSSKKNTSNLSYFSVGHIRGSSHLAQKHVAWFRHKTVQHSEAEKSVKSIHFVNMH